MNKLPIQKISPKNETKYAYCYIAVPKIHVIVAKEMQGQENKISRVCPQCGKNLDETGQSCPNCGWKIAPPPKPPVRRIYSVVSIILGVICFIFSGIFILVLSCLSWPLGYEAIKKGDKLGYIGFAVGLASWIYQLWLMFFF
jgi:DNA-directed RNA polymerase subunit RPC12/RpoP